MKPMLPQFSAVEKYLVRMDENRYYSNNGPLHQELLQKYALMCGVPSDRIVLCANATLAIQGAAYLMPVERFFAPAFTFPATISGIMNAGKSVTLRDIEKHDWRIDLRDLEPSDKQGVIDVAPFGSPLDVKKLEGWEYVIFDAAASLGSSLIDLKNMRKNWVVVFSLHATKVLGIGEGGIAIFGSTEAANQFRAWINFGFLGSRESIIPGINGKLSEIAAAYGLAVLEQKDVELGQWAHQNLAAGRVNLKLGIDNITNKLGVVSPYWIVHFDDVATTKRIEFRIGEAEIETRRWWSLGCHRMPAFKSEANGKNFPNADFIAGTTLGLPMFRDMNPEYFQMISEIIKEYI